MHYKPKFKRAHLPEKHNHLSAESNAFPRRRWLKILQSLTFNKGHSHNMYTLIFPLIFTLLQCNKSQSLTATLKLAFLTKSHNLRNINHAVTPHLATVLNGHTFNWAWRALKVGMFASNKTHLQFLCKTACVQLSSMVIFKANAYFIISISLPGITQVFIYTVFLRMCIRPVYVWGIRSVQGATRPLYSNVAISELYLKRFDPFIFLRFILHVIEGLLGGMLKKCKSESLKAIWKAQNTSWIIQRAILPPSKWTFRETSYAFLIALENPPNSQSGLNVMVPI